MKASRGDKKPLTGELFRGLIEIPDRGFREGTRVGRCAGSGWTRAIRTVDSKAGGIAHMVSHLSKKRSWAVLLDGEILDGEGKITYTSEPGVRFG